MIPKFLDDALGFNIHRVGVLFRRELIRTLAEYNLTPEQWQVMAMLWSTSRPLSQNDIVKSTMRDKPTVSRMIQRLEKNGWVEKTPNRLDARVTMIRLTGKGDSHKREISSKVQSHFRRIFHHLEVEESVQFKSTLKKLRYLLGDD